MTVSLADRLAEALGELPVPERYCVAYSGGCDSYVLLDLLAAMARTGGLNVAALHVDHAVNPQSARWVEHCREVCRGLGVEFRSTRIESDTQPGLTHESALRERRYAALSRLLRPREMLLTAHHLDDQAETVLLQLLRGAGAAGLAAMPVVQTFGAGWHARPLLGVARPELQAYARERNLTWIEDDSNANPRFDRNFLRLEIVPRLQKRWPAAAATLQRAARHQADAAQVLEEIARADLELVRGAAPDQLSLAALARLSAPRRDNVLRHWLHELGLPTPGSDQLQRIHDEVIAARPDAEPCLRWPGAEVRRYRDALHASTPLPPLVVEPARIWRLDVPCQFEHGTLVAENCNGGGLRHASCPDDSVEVRFRSGGERLRPAGKRGHRDLRLLFQEQGVPPWQRERIPLLYIDGKLAAVAGLWIAEEYAAGADEAAWRIRWIP